MNQVKTVFQQNLLNITKEENNLDTIKDLIKLLILKDCSRSSSKMKLAEIYNYLGLDAFVDLIDIMNGQTIEFPDIEEFKDTIKIAISYYYKYLKNKNWDEIKEILNDQKCSSIKYGINCSKLHLFIKEQSEKQEFNDAKV